MKANELRIGNWVWFLAETGDYPCYVETTVDLPVIEKALNDDDFFDGIPLTEEWLLKFGFEKYQSLITSYSIDITGVTMSKSEILELSPNNDKIGYWYVYFRQGDSKDKSTYHKHDLVLLQRKLEYVHQLQNLYFSLTGKELEINS